jgi:hypothetical protein
MRFFTIRKDKFKNYLYPAARLSLNAVSRF